MYYRQPSHFLPENYSCFSTERAKITCYLLILGSIVCLKLLLANNEILTSTRLVEVDFA
jgi:hypothetical protein